MGIHNAVGSTTCILIRHFMSTRHHAWVIYRRFWSSLHRVAEEGSTITLVCLKSFLCEGVFERMFIRSISPRILPPQVGRHENCDDDSDRAHSDENTVASTIVGCVAGLEDETCNRTTNVTLFNCQRNNRKLTIVNIPCQFASQHQLHA